MRNDVLDYNFDNTVQSIRINPIFQITQINDMIIGRLNLILRLMEN